jgi:predicted translin family RNA/ssDNA-binding protein
MQTQTQEPNKLEEIVQVLDLARVIYINTIDFKDESQKLDDLSRKSIQAAAQFNDIANQFLAIATKKHIE